MKYEELINHLLGNAKVYIDIYSKQKELTEEEKGIVLGLWMSLDCIKNQLIIEEMEENLDLENVMKQLTELREK